jgi:hypothetical protein
MQAPDMPFRDKRAAPLNTAILQGPRLNSRQFERLARDAGKLVVRPWLSEPWRVTAFSVSVIAQFGHAEMTCAPARVKRTVTISSG